MGDVEDAARRQATIARYALYGSISAGGVASVHFGKLLGPAGFTRIVAIKRLHPSVASDPEAVTMFLDEARITGRIHHPNVVGALDVVEENGEVFLVMEYVAGLSLSALTRANPSMPPAPEDAVAIAIGALTGLHAAHEATNAAGESLAIVHRDVSPPNILVGEDGIARVIDFGIAKANERVHATRDNDLRGKVLYMAPEQLARAPVDRRADIYAASVVLWEMLTSRRYVDAEGASPAARVAAVLERRPSPPSEHVRGLSIALDDAIMRGLAREPSDRFATALDMATALRSALQPSSPREVGDWVRRVAGDVLRERSDVIERIESAPLEPGDVASVAVTEPTPRRSFDPRPLAALVACGGVVLAWYIGTHQAKSPVVAPAIEPTTIAVAPEPSMAVSPAPPESAPDATPEEPPAPRRHPPPKRPSSACNPPYTLDHGIRVPKRECL